MEKIISDHFKKEWYFPHILGTLDGSGTRYYQCTMLTIALHYSVLAVMEAYL